jgi:hypothetical protein
MNTVHQDGHRNVAALTGLRIAVGILFLIQSVWHPGTLGGGFEHWVHAFLDQGAYRS